MLQHLAKLLTLRACVPYPVCGAVWPDSNRQFDVLKVPAQENTWMFYEVYDNEEAVAFHKAADHFKDWMAFENSGGVTSINVVFGAGTAGREGLMTPK